MQQRRRVIIDCQIGRNALRIIGWEEICKVGVVSERQDSCRGTIRGQESLGPELGDFLFLVCP